MVKINFNHLRYLFATSGQISLQARQTKDVVRDLASNKTALSDSLKKRNVKLALDFEGASVPQSQK